MTAAKTYAILGIAFLTLSGYCNGKMPKPYSGNITAGAMDSLYHLNLQKTNLVQTVNPGMLLNHTYRFVQVEVEKVDNPQNHPLIFYVYYRYPNSEKQLLSSFSLYPATNPGKFIVATHGKLNREGAIIVSLTTPAKIKPGDKVEVTIKKLTLLEK
ncbi:hypothetical protein SNE25_01755 [Mucilaginibacter sabulilitoris]|uniref:Uncharacterized protein n=1 Tax=Mucilaginibacter sabulilitoris TaxID=1173583 RepID=A0ABZ0TR61_9SPHI|nr:hypothetical protein [Mucilaginibacter sabulilitoris]WPU94249.1 hypothetical protein SNE25_01755 [Mucilaginibacter sabulilitoris]